MGGDREFTRESPQEGGRPLNSALGEGPEGGAAESGLRQQCRGLETVAHAPEGLSGFTCGKEGKGSGERGGGGHEPCADDCKARTVDAWGVHGAVELHGNQGDQREGQGTFIEGEIRKT